MNIKQFYTRPAANKGITVPLTAPDGSETDQYLVLLGVDSDAFKGAQRDFRIASINMMEIEDKDTIMNMEEEANLKMLACLIGEWSFTNDDGTPYPLTKENAIELLRNAPQIANKINKLSAQRALFTNSESNNSAKQQKKDSHLTKESQAQSKLTAKHSTKSGRRQVKSQKS